MQEENSTLLQPRADDLTLLGKHLLPAVKIAAKAERCRRLRKISFLHKAQHHVGKRQIDLICSVGRGTRRGDVDDFDVHRRTGAQHRKVHRGERAGKACAHCITRLDTRFFQKLHAQRCHVGIRRGTFCLHCTDGRGDGCVILTEHPCFVIVLVGKRNAEFGLVGLNLLHTGFQPLRRVHADSVVPRWNTVGTLCGQCTRKHQHERR